MLTTKAITRSHMADINIPNQPFRLFGLMLPAYNNGKWTHTEIVFPPENQTEMCFPDEHYDYDAMSADHVFLGAYDGEACIGLAIMRQDMFRYMYLYDLKVDAAYRGRGAGTLLMEACKALALEQGYIGVYTQAQDNNLGACRFYLKNGFEIGGLNTRVYGGTSQENKKDIFFYCDLR